MKNQKIHFFFTFSFSNNALVLKSTSLLALHFLEHSIAATNIPTTNPIVKKDRKI